jgi:hypothetical protein
LIAGLSLLLLRQRDRGTPSAATPRAAATIPQDASAPRGEATGRTRPPGVAAPAHTAADDGLLEVCGVGRVKLDINDAAVVDAYATALTKTARERWLAAALDSDDIRARAAGLLLRSRGIQGPQPASAVAEDRDALVQLAVGATDPAVYAMALYACGFDHLAVTTGACAQLDPAKWAALDPQNAAPWLLVALRARVAKDPAGEAIAFARAVGANRVDGYGWSLFAFAEPELPGDTTPLERWLLAQQAMGVGAAVGLPYYGEITQHCSRLSIEDDAIHDQCGALAETLVAKANTLLDFGVGVRIGERAGWPAARVAGLLERRDAWLQEGDQLDGSNTQHPWSCQSVRAGNAYLAQRTRLGELGALQAFVEESGESTAELAQKFRDHMERMRLELQRQAASAASAVAPP